MGRQSRQPINGQMVNASDLAQMGRCERLVVFEHLHGNRRTARQQRARARGVAEHAQYSRVGLVAITQADRRGRRFIAIFTFAKAWRSDVLRRIVRLRGRLAACLCKFPRRRASQAQVRMLLTVMATRLRCWTRWRGRGKCRH